MPRDYVRELDDPDKANAFIQEATTSNTAEISRAHAASNIYLAYRTRTTGEVLATSISALAHAIEGGLASHAQALRDRRPLLGKVCAWPEPSDMGSRRGNRPIVHCHPGHAVQVRGGDANASYRPAVS
jgi:hypothetical protein